MNITYYGHSAFNVELNGKNLVFDPFISPNELAAGIDVNSIKADYVLVSHGHEDHVADVEAIAKANNATVVSNFEIVTWFGAKGLTGHPMNTGGQWQFDFGTVKCVNAVHSSVLPDGTYAGNPMGFVVTAGDECLYYAGDTALTLDMKLIAERHKLTVAMLPMGDNFTMGIDDAVDAAKFVGASKVIGMHYDTFGYVKLDHEAAKKAFAAAGIELLLMEIGGTVEL